MELIPYAKQHITEEDIEAVVAVLRSDYLTQGPVGEEFEKAVASYCGANYGIAVNSATSALHLGCLALNLKSGDWVWTSPITFLSSANCALFCGANIDFVDIDPLTYNICPTLLREKLEGVRDPSLLPKLVIVVHYAGQPANMSEIWKLSKHYGFRIIEDASHALGASYFLNNKDYADSFDVHSRSKTVRVGNAMHSDMVVFSFHPVKIITTGEGGMVMTNDQEMGRKIRSLRTHGITRDSNEFHDIKTGEIWNYQQLALGFNFRLSDVNSALGKSQIKRLDEILIKRQRIASRYIQELQHLPISLPHLDSFVANSSWHLFPVLCSHMEGYRSQGNIYNRLRQLGIAANIHYIPVHLQPFYKKRGFDRGNFPNSEDFFRRVVTIPLYPSMTDQQQEYVINSLKDIFFGACG